MEQTMTAQAAPVHAGEMDKPDPEVPERAQRRRFSASYKMRILAETDKAAPGEVAGILRREGLYSGHLATWRSQRDKGGLQALSQRRGPKADPLAAENAKLRKQNEKLRRDLEAARLVIDVQKKVSKLLGIETGEQS